MREKIKKSISMIMAAALLVALLPALSLPAKADEVNTTAAPTVTLGTATGTGADNEYQFSGATVTEAETNPGTVKSIFISFSGSVADGDAITLPTVGREGFYTVGTGDSDFNAHTTTNNYAKRINIENGASVAAVTAYLQDVTFTLGTAEGHDSQTVKVILSTDKIEQDTFYDIDTEHYYQFISYENSDTRDWIDAYNDAKSRQFMGRSGYLATITDVNEDTFVYSLSENGVGWTGGTVLIPGSTVGSMYYDYSAQKIDLENQTCRSYWYWACGPERGTEFFSTRRAADGGSAYNSAYCNWNSGEPNNSGYETCLTTLYLTGTSTPFSWNDRSSHIDSKTALKEAAEAADETKIWNEATDDKYNPDGYFVEFGNKTTDSDESVPTTYAEAAGAIQKSGSGYTATVNVKDGQGNSADAPGAVTLVRDGISFDLSKVADSTGEYSAKVPAATYNVNISNKDTGTDIEVTTAGGAQDVVCSPTLTATGNSGNYVDLSWTAAASGSTDHYKVYQKSAVEDDSKYQTIPVSTDIKVLNVYPDVDGSDGLQGWMNTTVSGESYKMGSPMVSGVQYTMTVDKIAISTFNGSPESYLYKESDGSYNYDVVYFGAWDSNYNKDLYASAATVVDAFIQYGGGCLFGHDTAYSGHTNFAGLAESHLNMYCEDSSVISFYGDSSGSSTVAVLENGLLTNFPYKLTGTLTVPACHSTGQFAMGDVWMNFVTNTQGATEITSSGGYTGTSNFYLTTWNNCAMIQTGHSSGQSTEDEQKILTNTLYYLAQITKGTSASDHMSQDLESPDAVTESSITSWASGSDGEKISWTKPADSGSSYDYYLKEISEDGSSSLCSSTKSATVTTGVSGYYVLVDTSPTAEVSAVTSGNTMISDPSYTATGLTDGTDYYAHIVAVDGNDNLSGVTTKSFTYTKPKAAAVSDPSPLVEATLNGSKVTVTLTGTTFKDGTLSASNFTLNSAPSGVSIGSVSYKDANTCEVTLSYDNTVFSSGSFSLTVDGSELVCGSDLTTGTLSVTAKLHGTAQISGIAEFGEELTASLSFDNNTGTPSYQWLRGGDSISGATGNTYTPAEADIGKVISVEITSSAETGKLTSDPVTVAKAGTAKGTTPVLSSKSDGSITLTHVDGYEYAIVAHAAGVPTDGWQDSNVFTGLSEETEYDLYQRVKETDTALASEASDAISVKTYSSPSDTGDDDATAKNGGKTETVGTKNTETGADGRTTTTVTVDEDRMGAVIDSAETGSTITLPVTGTSDTAAGKLTGKTVKDMENKEATLEIQTDSASYSLPAEQIDIESVAGQLGEDVSLSDIDVTVTIAEPSDDTAEVVASAAEDGGFELMVPAVDFTISCEYGGRTVNVSNFNAYVERLIKIPDGVDHNKITTGVVVEPDGSTHHVPTEVTIVDGIYYAKINSLTNSTYAVVWHPIEFTDMASHWAKTEVNDMGSRMVVDGVGDNNYDPDRYITRAEFAKVMVRALGLEPGTGDDVFSDVPESEWYCEFVKTATSYGIIKGYPDGTFRPNETITREQAMTMMARAMKLTGLYSELTESEISALLGAYDDDADISAYAEDSIAVCLKTGVVNGRTVETIVPQGSVTRAEVAVMAERLLKYSKLI